MQDRSQLGPADPDWPFPSFSEIRAAALKALWQEIAATRRALGVGSR